MLDVCLVGTGGMMPLPDRWLSSAVVRVSGQMALLDCGEGTQISLKMLGWGFKDISAVLISHFHADHVAGLVGLLLMIGNSYREEELTIYGPLGLQRVVDGLRTIAPELPFPVRCQELKGGETFHFAGIEGSCLMVDHAVSCLAYSVYVRRGRRFSAEKARALNIPVELWKTLQQEQPVEWQGRWYQPSDVLLEPRRGLKLCYITDTRPTLALPTFVRDSDLLICEGMYGDPADHEKAVENKHLTFAEAAQIARRGKARELWLTHFSPSLMEPENYLEVARSIFQNTVVGRDRMCKTLSFGR